MNDEVAKFILMVATAGNETQTRLIGLTLKWDKKSIYIWEENFHILSYDHLKITVKGLTAKEREFNSIPNAFTTVIF